jgi:hypothetical protein
LPVIACSHCGKKLNAKDDWIGKKLKCPGCAKTFLALTASSGPVSPTKIATPQPQPQPAVRANVASAAGEAVERAKKRPRGVREEAPRVSINWGVVAVAGVVLFFITLGVLFYVGPVRNWNRWGDMQAQVEANGTDVIVHILRKHIESLTPPPAPGEDESDRGFASGPGGIKTRLPDPGVHEITFLPSTFAMSFPDKIPFTALSTYGPVKGFYHLSKDEYEMTIVFGGTILQSGIQVQAGNDKRNFTGRSQIKNGTREVTAEEDGQPIQ